MVATVNLNAAHIHLMPEMISMTTVARVPDHQTVGEEVPHMVNFDIESAVVSVNEN